MRGVGSDVGLLSCLSARRIEEAGRWEEQPATLESPRSATGDGNISFTCSEIFNIARSLRRRGVRALAYIRQAHSIDMASRQEIDSITALTRS